MIGIKEAAERLGVSILYLMKIIEVGDVVPTTVNRHDGELWREETEILFSDSDLEVFAAEIRERRFEHVFVQHGHVLDKDASFAFGKGWERIVRELATALGALDGPPRITGGKEKFGSLIVRIEYQRTQMKAVEVLKEAARKKSVTICEECGQPGRLRMGVSICKTTCNRHAHLAAPFRDDDGEINDLPPSGGPIYNDGRQGVYGVDR